jgi:hypothetical protein
MLFISSSYLPPFEPEPTWAVIFEFFITVYFLCDWILRFFLSSNRLKFYFSPFSLVDFITIVPGLVSLAISNVAFSPAAWAVARTLRVFRLFRVIRMMHVITMSFGSSFHRQIALLVATVLSMVFCAAGIYQMAISASDPTKWMPFHRAMLYMTIIVIGRPPVPHDTDAAVIFVMIMIMISAFVIPAFIAELARLYFETQGREAYSLTDKVPHVILCGEINASRVKAFLGQFYHKSRDAQLVVPLVILAEHKYEGALRMMIEGHAYGGKVTYVRGSARRPLDLKRAGVTAAATVIVLASMNGISAQSAGEGDMEVVSVCLAIKASNKSVKILAQLRKPRSKDHLICLPGWRDTDKAVATASLNMTMVGVGAIMPGLPTLLTNLIVQGSKSFARSKNPRRRKFIGMHALSGFGGIQSQLPESAGKTLKSIGDALRDMYDSAMGRHPERSGTNGQGGRRGEKHDGPINGESWKATSRKQQKQFTGAAAILSSFTRHLSPVAE